MTQEQKLERLTLLVDDDKANSGVLSAYLDIAKSVILNRLYPFKPDEKEIPEKYTNTQINIAVYLYNKRGAEGEVAHTENGISRTYDSADVPESLLKDIVPFAGLI